VTVTGTLIGFDFGERRIGIAVGETSTGIASPLGAIDEVATDARFREIGKLVAEWQPKAFVVGRPRHADDSEHAIAKLAEKFARRLATRFQLPVAFVDETLTSATAEMQLREARGGKRQSRDAEKASVDALAAAMILQSYLDQPEAHEHLAS
jgi:putative Holliday junction resolvase